jgi:hypothetical protein
MSDQPKSRPEALVAAPLDRDEVLSSVDAVRARVYAVASEIFADLDRVAPWSHLYYPPRRHQLFLEMNRGLLDELDRAGKKLEALLTSPEAAEEVDEAGRDDMRFYFAGIHEMVGGDVDRLQELLTSLSRRYASSMEEKSFVCQVAADLKGKYTSALMGAVASLVAEGRFTGAEIEPVLFPDRALEAEASQRLLDGLDELLELLDSLARQQLFVELYERWSQGEPADLYALADLFAFKGSLEMLLRSSQRRSLYSGDYHELRRREGEISSRLAELEAGHRLTWSDRIQPVWEDGDLSHLAQLVLELAGLLDSRALSAMVSEDWLAEMRAMAVQIRELEVAEGEEAEEGEIEEGDGGDRTLDLATAALPTRWASLVPLLAQPDLRRYLRDLRRSVEKRQTLRSKPLRVVSGAGEEGVEDTLSLEALDGEVLELVLDEDEGADAAPPEPEPPSEGPVEDERESDTPVASPDEALGELQTRLRDLRSTSNSNWNTFRMTERLLGKHGRIPPGMYASACPFVAQVSEEILPLATAVARGGALSEQEARRLESYCSFLLEVEPTPRRLEQAIPSTMKRLLNLLDALEGLGAVEDGSPAGQ